MSREIIIASWCNRCELEDRKERATHTYTVGVVKGETRPALKVLDLCDDHDKELLELLELLGHAIPLESVKTGGTGTAAPKALPRAPAQPAWVECRVCGKDIARASIINHVWSQHRPGEVRPAPPRICPDCGQPFATAGMNMHRNRMHGYTSLDEAYEGIA